MYFSIIDAQTDTSRLTTIAYGETLHHIARWFSDEFADTYDMYRDDSETEEADGEKVLAQCEELCTLSQDDALEMSDLEGLAFDVNGLSVELYGIYDSFEDFCDAFAEFVKDKPKYKKITPDKSASDVLNECDRLNTLLIKASI